MVLKGFATNKFEMVQSQLFQVFKNEIQLVKVKILN